MRTRAKFKVESKDTGTSGNVRLTPVYSDDPKHENKAFWDATPSGKIEMWINNPGGFATFEVGKEYYVDFTPADK